MVYPNCVRYSKSSKSNPDKRKFYPYFYNQYGLDALRSDWFQKYVGVSSLIYFAICIKSDSNLKDSITLDLYAGKELGSVNVNKMKSFKENTVVYSICIADDGVEEKRDTYVSYPGEIVSKVDAFIMNIITKTEKMSSWEPYNQIQVEVDTSKNYQIETPIGCTLFDIVSVNNSIVKKYLNYKLSKYKKEDKERLIFTKENINVSQDSALNVIISWNSPGDSNKNPYIIKTLKFPLNTKLTIYFKYIK